MDFVEAFFSIEIIILSSKNKNKGNANRLFKIESDYAIPTNFLAKQ